MPRIRTVKPEFWSDEKLASLPMEARLLYIGLWNFADDHGVVKGQPIWLRSMVFPYDDIQTTVFKEWLDRLVEGGYLKTFASNGETYLFIKNFPKHQKIDRPSQCRNPEPPRCVLDEGSTRARRCNSKGRVREGKVIVRDGKVSEECLTSLSEKYPDRDVKLELEKFNNYNLQKGRVLKNYDAGFRNWMINATTIYNTANNDKSNPSGLTPLGGFYEGGAVDNAKRIK